MIECENFEYGRGWLDKRVMPLVKSYAETLARGWVIDARTLDVLISGEICPCIKVRLEVEDKSGSTTFESASRGICTDGSGRVWTYTEGPSFPILDDYVGRLDSIKEGKLQSAFGALVFQLECQYSDPRRHSG